MTTRTTTVTVDLSVALASLEKTESTRWSTGPAMKTALQFAICGCTNPDCAVHLVVIGEDNEEICDASFDEDAVRDLVKTLQGMLYQRATEKNS
jgi:hypothetical protein